jgi:hypothetical protein
MAREDLNNLLSSCIPFAQQMLAKHGTFFPFGATMSPSGEISLGGGYDDKPNVDAQEIIALTLDGFRAGARSGEYRAVALCVDVRVDAPDGSGKTDAIRVTLEENGGEALNVFMPYRKRMLRGVSYGEIFASAADHSVFA